MQSPQWILTLVFVLPTLKAAPDPVIVNVNTKKVAHVLDERFVSLTVNPTDLLLGRPFGMGMNSTIKILQGLSPAYVRFGGPNTNQYVFETEGLPNYIAQSSEEFVITENHWKNVNDVMKKANLEAIACINSGLRNYENGKWDSRNALDLISFSEKQKMNVTWELGYELSSNDHISGAQIGQDISKLRSILNAFPRYQSSRLIGPDIRSLDSRDGLEHLLNILFEAGSALDAITWHPRWPQAGTIIPADSSEGGYKFPPDYLEWDRQQLNKILQRALWKKPFWISEPQGENTGSFAEGLILARRLGLAAKLGIEVVMKQPNLNDVLYPKPEYWVAVMHKKTLGRTLLESRILANQTDVTIVAHCTSNYYPQGHDGGITILAVNTGHSPHRTVIRGITPSSKQSEETVHQYILTAGGSDESIFSQLTFLNGEPLQMSSNGDLPRFIPKVKQLRQQMFLKLPPYSIGYYVIPSAKVLLCQEQSQPTADMSSQDPQIVNILNTAQKGIHSLRNINQIIADKVFGPASALELSKSNEERNTLGKFKRHTRDINIEELGRSIKSRVDEINEMMKAEIYGEERSSEKERSDHGDRLRVTEEKINGIANDLHNFVGKADQENEFGKFLELSGLKQNFGKLMVDERLARNKRKLSTNEEKVLNHDRNKREVAENLKNSKRLLNKLPRFNSLPNSGMDKINKELQEELLLREIALLEKTEETLTDAINSHAKKHELLDKKLRDELTTIKEEKLASLLEMKYIGQRLPDQDDKTMTAINKKLVELKEELAPLQNPQKREASDIMNSEIGVKSSKPKAPSTLETLRAFLNKRKEALGQSDSTQTNAAETKAGRMKTDAKSLRVTQTTQQPEILTTPMSLVSQPTGKSKFRARQRFEKKTSYPLESNSNTNLEKESNEEANRKTRTLFGDALNQDASHDLYNEGKSDILVDNILAPSSARIDESYSSSVSEEQVTEESNRGYSSSGDSDESGEGERISSERLTTAKNSALKEGEGIGFKLFKNHDRRIEPNTGETKTSAHANAINHELTSNFVDEELESPFQPSEPLQQVYDTSVQVTEAPQFSTESSQALLAQTTIPSSAQDTTINPSSQITTTGKERTRRNTHISQGIGRNNAPGGAESDENGRDYYKNALTKKKINFKNNELPTPEIVDMASSGVSVVLDDVIPETYDQTVLKLEHLVLPEYLQNLANVVQELKIVGTIFKGLSDVAIGSGATNNHVQKIGRNKRDTTEIEKEITERETPEIMNNKDEVAGNRDDVSQLVSSINHEMGEVQPELLQTQSEAQLTDSMPNPAQILKTDEEVNIEGSTEKQAFDQSSPGILETTTELDLTSTTPAESKLVRPTTKPSPKVRTSKKSHKVHEQVIIDDPKSPWLASTHNIIEHVIENLLKKQEELEDMKSKGKREIGRSGHTLRSPVNFKLDPGKPLSPMPQSESVNQFMRQLRPGVYVVPSKDMTNVHADQVNADTKDDGPSVMTLNIYYDKKKGGGGEKDETPQNYYNSQNLEPKQNGWPNSGTYNVPYPSPHSIPAHVFPSAQPAPYPPATSLFASKRPYDPRYPLRQAPTYSLNPPVSYQPAPPNYDESYSLLAQEPRYDGSKVIPITSFTPRTAKNSALDDSNALDWDPELDDKVDYGKPPKSSEQQLSKQESDAWYMRKAINEPPVYIKKEIPRTNQRNKSTRPALTDVDKKRTIEPYWNRTIKEIFQETSNEPFWDFLKSPEEPYSGYASGEHDLNGYVSSEQNDKEENKAADEKDEQKLRRKRSLYESTASERSKRLAPFLANPSNNLIGNFDTKPFDQAWASSQRFEDDDVPNYHLLGRIINFNGIPSRQRRDHNPLLTNELYKIKPRERLPLDSSRITHGILPKSIFRSSPLEDSIDTQVYNLNENVPIVEKSVVPSSLVLQKTPSAPTANFSDFSYFDESALRQFYDFAIQLFKSMTAYA